MSLQTPDDACPSFANKVPSALNPENVISPSIISPTAHASSAGSPCSYWNSQFLYGVEHTKDNTAAVSRSTYLSQPLPTIETLTAKSRSRPLCLPLTVSGMSINKQTATSTIKSPHECLMVSTAPPIHCGIESPGHLGDLPLSEPLGTPGGSASAVQLGMGTSHLANLEPPLNNVIYRNVPENKSQGHIAEIPDSRSLGTLCGPVNSVQSGQDAGILSLPEVILKALADCQSQSHELLPLSPSNGQICDEDLALATATLEAEATGSQTPLIKEELRYTIRKKRVQSEQDDIQVIKVEKEEDSIKSKIKKKDYQRGADPTTERKQQRRRDINNKAAQKCRLRKREQSRVLVKEMLDEQCTSTRLKYEIHQLEKEKERLEKILRSHLEQTSVCKLKVKYPQNNVIEQPV